MRVVHVTPYFAPAYAYGGPPVSILGLCRALQDVGVGIEVVTTTANGDSDLPIHAAEPTLQDGVRTRYFSRTWPRRHFGARGLAEFLRSRLRTSDLLHIHGLWNLPSWSAGRLAIRMRVPYAISPRGMLQSAAMGKSRIAKAVAYRGCVQRVLKGAALIHATSADERERLRQLGFEARVALIPNATDLIRSSSLEASRFRHQLGVEPGAKLITFLGRVHRIKRLDILAQAFCSSASRCPEAHLVIAGPVEDVDVAASIARSLHSVAERVHWAGLLDIPSKTALLSASEALVLCSDSENFGLSVVEAMAVGTPVITSDTTPWTEVGAWGAGYCVPQDADAISSAIDDVLNDPAMCRELGHRGQEVVRDRFSWASVAVAMRSRYEQVLSGMHSSDPAEK